MVSILNGTPEVYILKSPSAFVAERKKTDSTELGLLLFVMRVR